MKALKAALVMTAVVLSQFACGSNEVSNSNATAPPANVAPSNENSNAQASASGEAVAEPAAASRPGEAAPATPAKEGQTKPAAGSRPAGPVDAAGLFEEHKCVTCHGPDGKGKLKGTPDFTDAAWQKKESDAEFLKQIRDGKKPMPAYADKLSEEEMKALVKYVRSFAKN